MRASRGGAQGRCGLVPGADRAPGGLIPQQAVQALDVQGQGGHADCRTRVRASRGGAQGRCGLVPGADRAPGGLIPQQAVQALDVQGQTHQIPLALDRVLDKGIF